MKNPKEQKKNTGICNAGAEILLTFFLLRLKLY